MIFNKIWILIIVWNSGQITYLPIDNKEACQKVVYSLAKDLNNFSTCINQKTGEQIKYDVIQDAYNQSVERENLPKENKIEFREVWGEKFPKD